MSWTYSASAVSSSYLYQVRLVIGDTDSARQQLQDEEIQWVLSQETAITYAAASCCDMLAAKYSFLVNTENSELRVSAAARHKHYMELADRLRRYAPGSIPGVDGGITLADMYAGGTLVADKETLYNDTGLVQPALSLGQDDSPEATPSGGGGFDPVGT